MPARCPTCDREECPTIERDRQLCSRAASDCRAHAVDWRARALAAEADAAKWRKFAPLIDRGDLAGACAKLSLYYYAAGKPFDGLKRRRAAVWDDLQKYMAL